MSKHGQFYFLFFLKEKTGIYHPLNYHGRDAKVDQTGPDVAGGSDVFRPMVTPSIDTMPGIFLFFFIFIYFLWFTWDYPVNEEIPNST